MTPPPGGPGLAHNLAIDPQLAHGIRIAVFVLAAFVMIFTLVRSFVHRSVSHTWGNRTIAAGMFAAAYGQLSAFDQPINDRTAASTFAVAVALLYVAKTAREDPADQALQHYSRRRRRRRR